MAPNCYWSNPGNGSLAVTLNMPAFDNGLFCTLGPWLSVDTSPLNSYVFTASIFAGVGNCRSYYPNNFFTDSDFKLTALDHTLDPTYNVRMGTSMKLWRFWPEVIRAPKVWGLGRGFGQLGISAPYGLCLAKIRNFPHRDCGGFVWIGCSSKWCSLLM